MIEKEYERKAQRLGSRFKKRKGKKEIAQYADCSTNNRLT